MKPTILINDHFQNFKRYNIPRAQLVNASALEIPLRDKSVHSIVTSPPYFGLRNYSGKQMVDWPAGNYSPCTGAPACIEVPAMRCGFGSEQTVEAYIFHALLVLRECKRVLRDDGVVWWNLGDSFLSEGGQRKYGSSDNGTGRAESPGIRIAPIKQGNLIGIPARFMLAAQADGWIVRNDCVWHKKSPMPESVSGARWVKHKIKVSGGNRGRERQRVGAMPERPQQDHNGKAFAASSEYINCPGCDVCALNDGFILKRGSWRHTRAHEFVFQLTKKMSYWSDGDAVKERHSAASIHDIASRKKLNNKGDHDGTWIDLSRSRLDYFDPAGSNPRSVLSPAPSNYRGAHFATFPPELIRNLIKSSTPKKRCAECGAGYVPVVKLSGGRDWRNDRMKEKGIVGEINNLGGNKRGQSAAPLNDTQESSIIGYRPTCSCNAGAPIPGVCLDPFVGSGTTLQVCRELGVNGIGLDISFTYLHEQATKRAEKRIPQVIVDRFVDELPLFSCQKNIFTRIVLDGRNGTAKLKTEEVNL